MHSVRPLAPVPEPAQAAPAPLACPSLSALRAARLRAAHRLFDQAPWVHDDPVGLRLLPDDLLQPLLTERGRFDDPVSRGVRAALLVRARHADEVLAERVAAGVRQVVFLGAGLETFPYRPSPLRHDLAMFEVDRGPMQAWKRERLAAAHVGVPRTLRYVAADLGAVHELPQRLAEAGWRDDRPTCVTLLGVSMYLRPETMQALLRWVGRLPAGSSIVFDYRPDPSTLAPGLRRIDAFLAARMAEEGEHWLCSFDPVALAALAREAGFSALADLGAEALNERYLGQRGDDLRLGGGLRLFSAVV